MDEKQKLLCEKFIENAQKAAPWEKFINPFTNKPIVKGSATYTKLRKECQSVSFEKFIKNRKLEKEETINQHIDLPTQQIQSERDFQPKVKPASPKVIQTKTSFLPTKTQSPIKYSSPKFSSSSTSRSASSSPSRSLSPSATIPRATSPGNTQLKRSIQTPEISPDDNFRLYFTPSPKPRSASSSASQSKFPEMRLYLSSSSPEATKNRRSRTTSPQQPLSRSPEANQRLSTSLRTPSPQQRERSKSPEATQPTQTQRLSSSSTYEMSPEFLQFISTLPKSSPPATKKFPVKSPRPPKKQKSPSPLSPYPPIKTPSPPPKLKKSPSFLSPSPPPKTKSPSPPAKYDLEKCKKLLEQDSKTSDGETIKNPFTDRQITKGKPTYKKLIKECTTIIKSKSVVKISSPKKLKSKRLSGSGEFDLTRFLEED